MNSKYHIHDSYLKCPYCDEKCNDDDYTVELENQNEFECDHCGKVFWAETTIVYNTHSDCKLNNEDHEFENDCEKYPTVFNCKNCCQHEVRAA